MPSSPFLCSRESKVRGSVAEVCANFISGQQYTAYVDTYVCVYVPHWDNITLYLRALCASPKLLNTEVRIING